MQPLDAVPSNENLIKEFSVSEISAKIKEILEDNIGYVRVKGEISGFKVAASGHAYFNIKDNFAVLGCTCWRQALLRVKFPINDGLEVIISGKITAYSGQSRYQISVDKVQPSGEGAMMQILKERRERLQKEGLFDESRKKTLPFLPTKIGVITSITGAVIKDIIHRISDRCPINIIIWPVTVQGDTAAFEIKRAIEGFNNVPNNIKPELLIVARGGGSIEDLWPFNEEVLVRAAIESKIPIISAVGHETDYTLIDLAADVRAPTPTAAAEFAVPVLSGIKYALKTSYNSLSSRVKEYIAQYDQRLVLYNKVIKYYRNYTEMHQQRLDELDFRFRYILPNLLQSKAMLINQFSIDRLNPIKTLEYKILQLNHQYKAIINISLSVLANFQNKLSKNELLLDSLNYKKVLQRGFTIIKANDGKFISSKKSANDKEGFNIIFHDGELEVKKVKTNKSLHQRSKEERERVDRRQ